MLRSAISAFTRVFDVLWLGGVVRCWSGVHHVAGSAMGPGSAEQREGRCTASGTREEIALRGRVV